MEDNDTLLAPERIDQNSDVSNSNGTVYRVRAYAYQSHIQASPAPEGLVGGGEKLRSGPAIHVRFDLGVQKHYCTCHKNPARASISWLLSIYI